MTVTRDPPRRPDPDGPAGRAPGDDPLARVGRQLIAAEQRLRWRRTRRRVVGGTAAGGLLVAACVAAVLPGGPLGGSSGDETLRGDRSAPSVRGGDGRGSSAASGATLGVRGEVRLHLRLQWGGVADETVLDRVRGRLATVGYPDADVRGEGSRIAVGLDWARERGSRARQRSLIIAMLGQTQVSFYDWEASVVDRSGRPIAGRTDAWSREASQGGGLPYAGMTFREARLAATRIPGTNSMVQALGRDGMLTPRDHPRSRFYVLRGKPPATGADISGVHAVRNSIEQPAVRIDVRPGARERFHALTREVSRRGQSLMLPGVSSAAVAQHFAIVLDDHLLSVSAIDPSRLPDGIDGERGLLIEGGFTRERARVFEAGLNAMGGPLPPLTPPVFERGG